MIRFTSKVAREFTKFVPIEPAPPVTNTVLRRKVSERSSMLLRRTILALHPLDGSWDAFLGGNLWVMLQIPDRPRAVHRFGLRGEGLSVLVGDKGIVVALNLQDEIRVGLDVPLPFRATRDVVDLAGDEVVDDVREGSTGVLNVVDDSLVPPVDYVWLVVQSMVDEFRNEAAVRCVMLARAVTVHWTDADGFSAELFCGIQAHQFSCPFCDRIIVELFDRNRVHHFLFHDPVVVPVDLRTAEENQTELQPFLQADNVLGPDRVRLPEILVVLFTVPAAIFGSQVVDGVEPPRLEESLQLAKRTDIAANIGFLLTVVVIDGNDLVAP